MFSVRLIVTLSLLTFIYCSKRHNLSNTESAKYDQISIEASKYTLPLILLGCIVIFTIKYTMKQRSLEKIEVFKRTRNLNITSTPSNKVIEEIVEEIEEINEEVEEDDKPQITQTLANVSGRSISNEDINKYLTLKENEPPDNITKLQVGLLVEACKEADTIKDKLEIVNTMTKIRNSKMKEIELVNDSEYKEEKLIVGKEEVEIKRSQHEIRKKDYERKNDMHIKSQLHKSWKYTFISFITMYGIASLRYFSDKVIWDSIKYYLDFEIIEVYMQNKLGYFMSGIFTIILPVLVVMLALIILSYVNVSFTTITITSLLLFLTLSDKNLLFKALFHFFKGFLILGVILSTQTYVYYKTIKYNVNEYIVISFVLFSFIIGWVTAIGI